MRQISVKVGFIGAGVIAEAMMRGFLAKGRVAANDLIVSDVNRKRLEEVCGALGVRPIGSNREVVASARLVFLAVKPQVMSSVLSEISADVGSEHVIISPAAGVRIESIEKVLAPGVPVIRIMPNTCVRLGEGVVAYSRGRESSPDRVSWALDILGGLGLTVEVPEGLMDAVTGLSGSGPAFVYIVIEALADGGVRAGLPRQVASLLAAQTVLGAARMVLELNEHPGRLKDAVASPGGTTIAGIHALERAGVRGAFMDAVLAATERSRELGSKLAQD